MCPPPPTFLIGVNVPPVPTAMNNNNNNNNNNIDDDDNNDYNNAINYILERVLVFSLYVNMSLCKTTKSSCSVLTSKPFS